MNLLIVDDQHSVHMYLEKALDLKALGFDEVLHAENGTQAHEMLRERNVDVMLLDIQMPVMNGLKLLELLRGEGLACPETIVLTAYDEFDYAKRCIDFGVSRYVLKPIDPHQMTRLLCEVGGKLRLKRLERYRWAFDLICAHLYDGVKTGDLPPIDAERITYGVLAVNSADARRFELAALDTICRCSIGRVECLLIEDKPIGRWDELRASFRHIDSALGMSRLRDDPSRMRDAAREAVSALRQSFYKPAARYAGDDIFSPITPDMTDALRAIGDGFDKQSARDLADMARRAFDAFAKAPTDPDDVVNACRDLLIRLCVSCADGSTAQLGSWPNEGELLSASAVLESLTGEILRLHQRFDPVSGLSDAQILSRVRAYVDEHYGEDLSLSAMASRFFISRCQISRMFKQLFGVNYQDYVLSVRMKAAAQMLVRTRAPLYEISLAVGFDEPSYFSNVFKKAYGQSPRAYRLAKEEKRP